MKNINKIKSLIIIIGLIIIASCSEQTPSPLSKGEIPDVITDIIVESLPGAARISYKLPSSSDFLYSKIEYETKPGVIRSIKSSLYERNVLLEGFAKEGTYRIKIYSIGIGETQSEPVLMDIKVLEPPYVTAFKALKTYPNFSGIALKIANEHESKLGINVSSFHDDVQAYRLDRIFESTQKSNVEFRIAGYETKLLKFSISIFDRFGNTSDTLFVEHFPYEEEKLDKSKFKGLSLPPYNNKSYDAYCVINNLWNDQVGNYYLGYTAFRTPRWLLYSDNGQYYDFSFDIGQQKKLSRFKIFHPHAIRTNGTYAYDYAFADNTPQKFELWGSNNPSSNGSWTSWTKIGDFESTKPAGMSTAELKNYAYTQGEDFLVPAETGEYRYYRFRVKRTWGNTTDVGIDEITLYGGSI